MVTARAFSTAAAFVELGGEVGLVREPTIFVDEGGSIERIVIDAASEDLDGIVHHDLKNTLLLPGFVNAHSHAFQRAIRGATGRRGEDDPSSFWSWREAMYGAATRLDPDTFFEATRACFGEMLRAGITCVGEFHYVHHRPDGRPYDDPNALSWAVVEAAREVGLRLCLLEVFYERGGAGAAPAPEQRRFCDASVDAYLERIELLRARAAEGFTVGITPHSVRAVGADALRRLAAYANEHDLVVHAHVSEQPRENEECLTEHGKTPMHVFADAGCLDRARRFTAVHAVHVSDEDIGLLGRQHVCACPTTESDLGDGIVPASRHLAAGTTLALGSDSNAVIDLVQEARLLEMNERLRTQSRLCLRDAEGRVAPTLLRAATEGGASSLGLAAGEGRPGLGRLAPGMPFDAVAIDLHDASLRDVDPDHHLDALMLSGSARPVHAVWVGGQRRL
jgi:formimidoylglutamate deiminase